MHNLDTWPETFLKRVEKRKADHGSWVLREPIKQGQHSPMYKIEITNEDQLQDQNPMFTNKLHLSFKITLYPFKMANAQIMIQLTTEQTQDVDFNQVCVLQETIERRPKTHTAEVELDITEYSLAQRSTLKICTFWDVEQKLDDALENSFERINRRGQSKQFQNLFEHRMIAYWRLFK